MKYKTRGNASPQGMQKIYFTGHPADLKMYFESISDQILSTQNCAIFYDDDPEHPDDPENFLSDLDRMQLIVIVVTSRYVYNETFAHNTVFNYAVEHHIPVLPILEESDIEDAFNKKCGDLQFLNHNSRDLTEISYEEKLKKFLDSVLVGDELAKMVRQAFDAYVFLSYRKKDRQYAQKLMRLIHSSDFCRDIAIWYDEFLVPGENFNDAIEKAMKKSRLFALAVTPNLLEAPNYVMTTEYPAAKDAKKAILPVMLVPTDGKQLNDSYKEIPEPVDAENPKALEAALRVLLKDIVNPKNDSDPRHIFFIGLAYLRGIDVEVDHERAVEMITFSAEHGLTQAIEKLVNMYINGEGVTRSYENAAKWLRKLADKRKEIFDREQTEDNGKKWVYDLWNLGNCLEGFGQITEAEKAYHEMLAVSKLIDGIFGTDDTKRNIMIGCSVVGDICLVKGDLSGARTYYEKCFEISKRFADLQPDSVKVQRDLSISYNRLGDICKAQDDLTGAKKYYEKCLETSKRFADLQPDSVESQRDLSISYNKLGDICNARGDLTGAKEYYEKTFKISKRLADLQPGSISAQGNLSAIYNKLGDICKARGDLTDAKKYYEKAIEIDKRLANLQPDSVSAQGNLSVIYSRLGDICNARKNLTGAKKYYEKAFEIRKRLADLQPDSVESQRALSIIYNKLGDICDARKDLTGAKEYYEKAFEIVKRLADLHPDSVSAQRDLSESYNNIGYIYLFQKDLTGAKEYYEKAFEIVKRLADQHPDPVSAQGNLAVIYNRLGDICKAQDDLKGAKKYYEKCFEISKRLADLQPDFVSAQENLFAIYKRLGDICQTQGKLTGAKKYYEKCLETSKRFADLHPDSVEGQRNLSISYICLGDICNVRKDLTGAKEYYEKACEIRKRLADLQPGSVEAQGNLSVIYNRLGNICRDREDLPSAKKYYEKAIKIDKRLANLHPGSVEAQRDLSVSYVNIGYMYSFQKDLTSAKEYFDKAFEIRTRLADILKTPQAYDDLADSYISLACVCERKERKIYLNKAKDILKKLVKQYPDVIVYFQKLIKIRIMILLRFRLK